MKLPIEIKQDIYKSAKELNSNDIEDLIVSLLGMLKTKSFILGETAGEQEKNRDWGDEGVKK